jgi:hypothetical protein
MTQSWKVVKRMLDKDNVDRFVFFNIDHTVIYYEYYKSISFVDWLGIPEKEAFYYLASKNRIYVDLNGIEASLELSDEQVDSILIKEEDKNITIQNDILHFSPPIRNLSIKHINSGRRRFASIGEFKQYYLARIKNLLYYSEKYKNLTNSLLIYTTTFIDEKDGLRDLNKKDKYHIRKHGYVDVIFAGPINGQTIEIADSYLNYLFTKLINNEKVLIYHPAMEMYDHESEVLRVNNFHFLNKLCCDNLAQTLVKLVNEQTYDEQIVRMVLLYTTFELLERLNSRTHVSYIINKLNLKLEQEIAKLRNGILSTHEDKIIEFKDSDYVAKDNKNIINDLARDLRKKLDKNAFKIYLIGINEKQRHIRPVSLTKFPDERLATIEDGIKKELDNINLHVKLTKIPFNDNECLLMLIAHKII